MVHMYPSILEAFFHLIRVSQVLMESTSHKRVMFQARDIGSIRINLSTIFVEISVLDVPGAFFPRYVSYVSLSSHAGVQPEMFFFRCCVGVLSIYFACAWCVNLIVQFQLNVKSLCDKQYWIFITHDRDAAQSFSRERMPAKFLLPLRPISLYSWNCQLIQPFSNHAEPS